MFGWQRDPAIKGLVEFDALALMREHGAAAGHFARERAGDSCRGVVVGERPARHWHKVRWEIARRTGRQGLGTAWQMAELAEPR